MKKPTLFIIILLCVVGCGAGSVPGGEASAKESGQKASKGPMANYSKSVASEDGGE